MSELMTIRNELECPVCIEYMFGEIYVCKNGHSICKGCAERVESNCPICRGLFEECRNYTLEKIAAIISYPCKICKVEFKGAEMANHEMICDSGMFTCNTFFISCGWTGPYSEAKSHIEEHHQKYIKTWNNIDNNYQLYILFEDEKPFFVFFKFAGEKSIYSCVYIGPKKDSKDYNLNVKLENSSEDNILKTSTCIAYCRLRQVFETENINFNTADLNRYLKNDGYFASTITINKKE